MGKQKIGFLGPVGTFGHEAVKTWLPKGEYVPYPSHLSILEAVEKGEIPLGVVGVENSVAGPVIDVQDHLIHDANAIQVCGEVVLPINQCAWAKPGTVPGEVRVVLSHPTGLEQCSKNIRRMFPNAELKKTNSTAEAVREMLAMDVPAVAIAGKAAAQEGAVILQENVQDRQGNSTRFWVVGRRSARPTGCDKTSLVFELYENAPGALLAVLALFASRGLNLSKVESRPNKETLGRYVFLVDVEAHKQDPVLKGVLQKVRACTPRLRVFGSYPRWREQA
ncbi:MAG: prephenate dehydratase [Candidatus Wildermuthbacteria bacterium]|nr:prephenate dehydratase [Candidatus Wildermuthbacteria bacterium]